MQNEQTLQHRLVHLDLKGAPLSVNYMQKIFPYLKRWGTTGLLVEYEDTFPYDDSLSILKAPNAYSKEEIKEIQHLAALNDLLVIPLVQTFGHLEFVLKHDQFGVLREVEKYPMALCPSNPDALSLVCKMVDQVMQLHPDVKYFHIGCDEVFHLGLCEKCMSRMSEGNIGKEQIFFSHVRDVASHLTQSHSGVTCIVWDDMFRFSPLPVILNCKLVDLVEPMIWHYLPTFALPNDMWDNLSAVFPNIWVASAFKGATGPRATVTNIQYHIDNHYSWLETLRQLGNKFKSVRGIAITGWQRYDHYAVLCELFPHALPCLALCLKFIAQGTLQHTDVDHVSKELQFTTPLPVNPCTSRDIPVCDFPGSQVYQITIECVHLEAACNEFFSNDGLLSWMNDYNIKRNFINPVHAEPFISRAQSLLQLVLSLKEKIFPSFNNVFLPGVSTEWCEVLVQPLITRLEDFLHRVQGTDVSTVSVVAPGTNMLQDNDVTPTSKSNTGSNEVT